MMYCGGVGYYKGYIHMITYLLRLHLGRLLMLRLGARFSDLLHDL